MNQTHLLFQTVKEFGLIAAFDREFGKNINMAVPFSREACNTFIDEIPFSVRSVNALKRTGIFTISELIDAISDGRIMKIRNLGEKSRREIKTRLLLFGYSNLSETAQLHFLSDCILRNQ